METNFAELLESALSEPGKIAECYSQFWNYSFGNQLMALEQCTRRGIPLGPISTFVGWKEKGRYVKKGERAITLCMPVTGKRTEKDEEGNETTVGFTRFVWKANWFVASCHFLLVFARRAAGGSSRKTLVSHYRNSSATAAGLCAPRESTI